MTQLELKCQMGRELNCIKLTMGPGTHSEMK